MLKSLLAGGVALALWFVTSSLPAQAQTQAPTMPPQEQQAPASKQISDQELEQFASVIKQLQSIQETGEVEMLEAVQRSGLSPERYLEILRGQSNTETQPTSEVTDEEQQNFEQARNRLIEIQQMMQSKMQQAVEAEGLNVERFEEILVAIQQNPTLQQRVEQLLQG
ncbi:MULTISPECIES: DUF4168 domain-containing protein [unclassified Coleofasciculus]|uniref:DUF4168 domain-containing protein n=1 Tax=unclassified Coleofasciculus TaxID=2692782 RepID=UPI00187F5925|nr:MULTISPECIES: DUF4168 domain-containing protein [unclassified Coleofasciculus]MBE9129222.1 DUF4168 domain-containing protein [Coleofasciculus sp. LEGE 07081]MBE9151896.1 DUF4168 domain-containing protein [Coleofasciculus sp. LEGE 07092]